MNNVSHLKPYFVMPVYFSVLPSLENLWPPVNWMCLFRLKRNILMIGTFNIFLRLYQLLLHFLYLYLYNATICKYLVMLHSTAVYHRTCSPCK